jgi:hypothetical protein
VKVAAEGEFTIVEGVNINDTAAELLLLVVVVVAVVVVVVVVVVVIGITLKASCSIALNLIHCNFGRLSRNTQNENRYHSLKKSFCPVYDLEKVVAKQHRRFLEAGVAL